MISVVIVCFNEVEKLDRCLKSISGFADEIVVVDLGSVDGSLKVCQKYNANIYEHKLEPFVEKIRNFAISKTKGEWVLILDPDEVVTEGLKVELKKIIESPKDITAVNIPRKNIFFDKWIKHTNWWPDRHIRFFKKDKVTWSKKIHSYPKVAGRILNLDAKENLAIEHYGYKTIPEFISRQNRYSDIEAEQRFQKGDRFSYTQFIWKPSREFLVRYIKHVGFLDGLHGFVLTLLMMFYQLIVMVKIWEREKNN